MHLLANMPATSRTCARCFSTFSGKGRAVYCAECQPKVRQERQAGYDKARGSRARSGRAIPTVPCKGGCGTLVVGAALHGATYCTATCRATVGREDAMLRQAVAQHPITVGQTGHQDYLIQQQPVVAPVPTLVWACRPCGHDGLPLSGCCPACGQEPPCASL